VRAWSLIITLYGDAIVPRGGSLWLGSLSEIMALFRIDAGHVRTAMSRLTADGWLTREKAGRNSYYRLSRREQGGFIAATQRIYFTHTPLFDGRLRLALLGPGLDDRSAVRPMLEGAGFTALSPTAYVAFADPAPPLPATEGLFLLHSQEGEDLSALTMAAWQLAPLAASYRAFIARFTPLEKALAADKPVAGADALVARVLLIHEFRRIVLRDPGLPPGLLPDDWPGAAARALTARLYRKLVTESEAFLDSAAQDQNGALAPAGDKLAERFGSE
jgi:phenylacetic acid degradation operon negative regulatory protein